uniref:hypothetical protein n=1 Tax=Cupriavidus yeoncheonensis TaxID=1462994 RepID=UPI003F494D5F
MNARFPRTVTKADSPTDDGDSVSVVSSCLSLTSVRTNEVRDVYRGYASVAVGAAVIAVVVDIVFFAVGILQ